MNEEELKLQLVSIQTKQLAWKQADQELLLQNMMKFLGSPDSELRDSLIYGTFCELIGENILSTDILEELLEVCLSEEFLFNRIGENGTDSVFVRAFTSLLIALILNNDNTREFLSVKKIIEVKDRLIEYIKLEKDLRGFVQEKGWAHSIAHVSDAFDELIKNNKLEEKHHQEILDVIWKKNLVNGSIYLHDEDERMLIPIMEILQRGSSSNQVIDLLESMSIELSQWKRKIPEQNYWYLVANAKKFLKSFYLVVSNTKVECLQPAIKKAILAIN